MKFLDALSNQINSQFSIGENATHNLNAVVDGQEQKYGSLGEFAKQIDQSAERRYLEEGFLRKDQYNVDPKQFEILMQEPDATVLIKKKMFSTVNENYRPDYMDVDEKLYYKAMKILFQNKCRQISALEKLSKIQKITSATGNISEQLVPVIIGLADQFGGGFNVANEGLVGGIKPKDVSAFTSVVDKLRKLYAYNTTNQTTSWITDPTNLYQSQFGQGTGVIEITNFTNFTTTVGLDLKSPGTFSFTVTDPYETMIITEYDIERAISDATNLFYNSKLFQFSQQGAEKVINDTTTRLNQLRVARGAGSITFKVNPDTFLGRRVVAIIDSAGIELPFTYNVGFAGIGGNVDVSKDYIRGGIGAGDLGLDDLDKNSLGPDRNIKALSPESELSVFKRLVIAIFNKIELDTNSKGSTIAANKLTNYARKKLRFNFCGHPIIQPMDSVHIYVNSKSRYDNKLLSGLQSMFTGVGILQNLNNTIMDFKNASSALFNASGSANFQIEKNSFVGPDFPNYLWSMIRGQFVTEKEGTHIFAGLVELAQDHWADGKFTLSVNGRDNTSYFEMGQVNFKPAADTFNGSLFDPLTPFNTKFDTISSNVKNDTPDLLEENKILLGTSQDLDSPLVKFKLGPNAGLAAHGDNFKQDSTIDKGTHASSKIYYAPDGLVYKWKQGIGTLVQFGNSIDVNDPNKVGNQAITKEPFAGQDIMNVLSLLVTGQPYNFITYWRATGNYDGFSRDPHSQQDAAASYYTALRNDLVKNNVTWGNFIPFKTLSIDEQSFTSTMRAQTLILKNNKDIDAKLEKLADAKRILKMFGGAPETTKDPASPLNIAQSMSETLNKDIKGLLEANDNALKANSALSTTGNDVSFNSSEFLNTDPTQRRMLRRQINFLTRRMSYNVRSNDDKNLFIIDDYYDKDYDILAFEGTLGNLSLYNNAFATVKDKIDLTSNLLNLEVFADTQGHVRVRPPQYNRMPSSIFYKMMFLKKSSGVQYFPQFLDDIFGDQIDTLIKRLEVVEDQVRLDCAVLDFNTDADCKKFILDNGSTGGSGSTFGFISDTDGKINNLKAVIDQANPESKDAINVNGKTFSDLTAQAKSTKDVFGENQRYKVILQAITDEGLAQAGYGYRDVPQFTENTRIDDLIIRIENNSGISIPKNSYLKSTTPNRSGEEVAGQFIDIYKVTQELSDKLKERQTVIKLLYSTIKNSTEARSLDDNINTSSSLFTASNYGNSHIPEIFEHMIEDETYDDYGPGSGSRYIIKRAQIKDISITANPPPFTYVEVQGIMDPMNTTLPSELQSFPQGGNGMVTAAAVDYDLWRAYGFRQQQRIDVPFLNDPNSQCAPYASMILSRARRNILRGSVTISGNEYMQPGEVIYLEDRGLLFYVSSVSHSFSFNTSFVTKLELTYGHTPGEYIPTTLDVVGKLLYKNRDISSYTIQRQTSAYNESSIGALQRGKNTTVQINSKDSNSSPSAALNDANNKIIQNILYTSAYFINENSSKGNTRRAKVELRIYFDKTNTINGDVKTFAQSVKQMLTASSRKENSQTNIFGSDYKSPDTIADEDTSKHTNPFLNSDDVDIVEIDMSAENTKKSPSQKAIDMSRNICATSSSNNDSAGASASKNNLRLALFGQIVDCWIRFEPIPAAQAKVNGS